MPTFRVERTGNYTVMSNHHLRNEKLSLKAKGLLSQMLSLPEKWNYTLSGLCAINPESKDAIRSALRELEEQGYVVRRQTTDASGKFSKNEYIIYEVPVSKPDTGADPSLEKPLSENPTTDNPPTGKPSAENPTQLNTKKSNTQKSKTDRSSTDSIPFRETAAAVPPEPKRKEADEIQSIYDYRELICENIEYDLLKERFPYQGETLDEILELIVEVVTAKRKYTRIAGSDFPHEVVRSRFLKLQAEHIQFAMDCMKENTTKIRNIKQYLLTVLYNAPTTISNYYSALVNHDMYGGNP